MRENRANDVPVMKPPGNAASTESRADQKRARGLLVKME